jgi:hypothetical protein
VTPPGWGLAETLFAAKLATAAGAVAVLLAGVWLRRTGRDATLRRTRDALLLGLGLAGWLGWWNFFAFDAWHWVHPHDGFHYFVGAKYFRELGYTEIYACTLAADLDAGVDPLAGSAPHRIRDLRTNDLVRVEDALPSAAACRARFTPERWRAFGDDVAWFRGLGTPSEWATIRADHGFNGSPVWLIAGSWLTNAVPSAAEGFGALARIDYGLLLATWIGVTLAFGWRVACIAAVFWGTNGFAVFDWTGGSVLRQDWLAALVLGLASLRRQRFALAGALLTTSTLLRIFPGLVVAAVAGKAALDALRARPLRLLGLSREHRRFAAGCIVALALLTPLATWRAGPDVWAGFAQNSRKLLATPLLNQMGLRAAAVYEPGTRARVMEDPQAADPFARWKRAQQEQLAQRWWIVAALGALYLALLVRALRRLEDGSAAALATGAVAIATQLTCYYHVALIGLAFLSARRELAGAALCALAGVTQWIWSRNPYSDVPFVWMSAAEVLTVFFVTALFAADRDPGEPMSHAPSTPTSRAS